MLTITALAALLATACTKEEGGQAAGPRSIVIDPTVLEMPKTTASVHTRATDVDFETGDAIGLTITLADGTKHADNARFSYNGGKFTSDDNLIWYEDIGLKSSLVAYHPYAAAVPTEFTVKADQTGGNYTLSDLMIATKEEVTPTLDATNMTFYHQLTKLVIHVNNQSGGQIEAVKVLGTVPTATVDVAAKRVEVKAGVAASDIVANTKTAGAQYFAIVVPQTVAPKLAVTVDVGGEKKTLTQTYKPLDLKPGQYTVSIQVTADKIDVTLTGDIEDWTDNGSLTPDDGVAFEEFDDYFLYDNERYALVTMKDGRKWMAENLRYVPKGKTVEADYVQEGDGIWYPLAPQFDQGQDKYVGVVSTEATVIAAHGYLYTFAAVMGVDAITEENSATFEGKQGICPNGWHVPTKAELEALLAAYPSAVTGKSDLAALIADGFTCPLTGMRMKNTSMLEGSISGNCYEDHLMGGYMMSSTKNQYAVNATTGAITTQNKCLMLVSNKSNTNASVSNASNLAGVPVRCIKDAAN